MQEKETRVQSLGWEDPLRKGMATHPSILAWKIPWTEELGGLQSMGLQESDMTEPHTQAFQNHLWPSFLAGYFSLYLVEKTEAIRPKLPHRPPHGLLPYVEFSSVQFSHSVESCSLRPHGLYVTCQASLSITSFRGLLRLMSIESVMPFNHLILCCLLLLLPSVFPASGSFQMSQFSALGGQSIGMSPLVLPMNI